LKTPNETFLSPQQLVKRWTDPDGNELINIRTLANWRCSDVQRGPAFRRFGNKIFYALSDVEAYEARNRFGTTRGYSRATPQAA
jgi:hypothetical protein